MPSPFVIPGVTLEEVLGACKAARGRDLYALAATAAKDLADYVRERRDDGDLEPVELAGAPAADPPSAAGAPTPSPQRSTAELEALLTDRGRAVLEALRAIAGEWRAARDLAALLDVNVDLLTGPIRDLRLTGLVEHNGKLRTAARIRVPPDRLYVGRESTPGPATAPDVTFPVNVDEDDDDGAPGVEFVDPTGRWEATRVEASPPSSPPPIPDGARWEGGVAAKAGPPAPAVSRRVRRELEAEQERARREAERPPATNGAGTLDGQALQRLVLFPSTIPELAVALGCHRAEAAAAIRRLEDDGDLDRRGKRSGEIVYGAHL